MVRKTSGKFKNTDITLCWILQWTRNVFFLSYFCLSLFYLIAYSFLHLCDGSFAPTFIHVSLSSVLPSPFSLSVLPYLFCLPCPCSLSGLPYFVQRRSQFDSISLVIQGSMEGELNLMDNLSGSICHYYSLPPRPSKHSTDKKVNNRQNDDSLSPCHV